MKKSKDLEKFDGWDSKEESRGVLYVCPQCGVKRVNEFPISDESGDKYCPDCNYTIEESNKYTQGPWILTMNGDLISRSMTNDDGNSKLILAMVLNTEKMDKENYANARLIAAAPELLEALKGFVDNAIDNPRYASNQVKYYRGIFRQAIAKAEGK